MASIDATIDFLNQLPQRVADKGKAVVKGHIMYNGHMDTENMYRSVQAHAGSEDVHIRVWRSYASYVNDGHGPSVPCVRKTWKKRNVSKLKFKVSPKWPGPIYAKYASGYPGSHFFDNAREELRAWVRTL